MQITGEFGEVTRILINELLLANFLSNSQYYVWNLLMSYDFTELSLLGDLFVIHILSL